MVAMQCFVCYCVADAVAVVCKCRCVLQSTVLAFLWHCVCMYYMFTLLCLLFISCVIATVYCTTWHVVRKTDLTDIWYYYKTFTHLPVGYVFTLICLLVESSLCLSLSHYSKFIDVFLWNFWKGQEPVMATYLALFGPGPRIFTHCLTLPYWHYHLFHANFPVWSWQVATFLY